ncbi:MAG: branched-chain amino acid ABC transporter permease [SAR86 cluster bacterium]|uniref:Branched-chain amino acid ABC transporter permease n=1 Tax=SAR86 cluster bacterium TaxID=2030880 RepID=A0A2A5C8N7_9GAMM|nr:MAG: branched-chain amino acid ABC transporter permease [SAR86 cluster bacterium]
MENLLQSLVAGVLTGSTYGLMCVGLTIIFGVMRVINFAQGEFMMLGMYFTYFCVNFLTRQFGLEGIYLPFVVAMLAGPVIYLFGDLLHRGLLNKVSGQQGSKLEAGGHYAQLVLTLGLALLLQNAGLYFFGSTPVSVSTSLSYTAWELGSPEGISVFINQAQSLAAILAVGVVLIFGFLIAKSRLGKSLRAAADNPDAAIYMGIDVERAHRIAFGFGVGITAIGGGLLASYAPFQPYIGTEYVIIMYAGVVLGGLGSIRGAFLGGLSIGILQQVSATLLPNQLQNTVIFVCFLAVILLRPNGFFGKSGRVA